MRYLIIFLLLFSTVNYATTLTVGPGCTYANIQLAVNAASSGDIIKVRDVTFTGSDAMVEVYDKSLIINGGYGVNCSSLSGNRTTFDADGELGSIMEFKDSNIISMTAFVSNVYLKNGQPDSFSGGGMRISGLQSTPLFVTLSNVKITNSQSYFGGAIAISNVDLHLVAGSILYNNTAILPSGNGGGIFCLNGSIEMQEADIGFAFGNTAQGNGGGIYLDNCDLVLNATSGTVTPIIRLNSAADGSGGGVYATNTSRIDLHGNQASISSNNARWGGGVSIIANSALYGDNGKINNNTASLHGGGFFIDGAGSVFDMDRYNSYPCGNKCSELSNNTSLYRSGAGSIGANTIVNIESSWIEGNKAVNASIAFENAGTLVLNNNMIINNQQQGIAEQLILTIGVVASTTVQLSTIAGTQLFNPSTSSLFDVTISPAATLTLDSNIIWDNNNNDLYSTDNNQAVYSGYNILQYTPLGTNTQLDPLFLAPGNDYHISSLSPAIGHANPSLDPNVVDIDAEDRSTGGALDAGADEYFVTDIIFINGFE